MHVKTIFELSGSSTNHVPQAKSKLPYPFGRELPIPDVNEVDVIRHYIELSRRNFGIDNGFYPLGSCTMKYNPKVNEDTARMEGFASLHPHVPESAAQGALELMFNLEKMLCEITGMEAFTLQPAAGAHGEFTSVMITKMYFRDKGEHRTKVIIPDSAHGTNPASAAICGYSVIEIKSDSRGNMDLEEFKKTIGSDVALVMLTNPNTLGLFDENVLEITKIAHQNGALTYCDGANMNAMLGITRPGDQGFDMMHLNLHKTFSTPHGGGGPGSGPVGIKKFLEEFLPIPRVRKNVSGYALDYGAKKTIGRVRAFYGNFGMLVRAYTYIMGWGSDLKKISESAVLNANYMMHELKKHYHLPYGRTCAHEFVLSAEKMMQEKHVSAMDIAKRLLDYGHHSPTIYFPLIVKEALMIEPTETESKATLDSFIDAMIKISQENPELLQKAPHSTSVKRLDGVLAARKPFVRWGQKEPLTSQ